MGSDATDISSSRQGDDPAEEDKSRVGDWEFEPIIGVKPWGAWVSRVDRASMDTVLEPVDGKTAVTEAIVRRMAPFQDRGHTCTADHGKEFAGHREIAAALGTDFDFATPDHSRERNLNEPTHGRVRQDFPKGRPLRSGQWRAGSIDSPP